MCALTSYFVIAVHGVIAAVKMIGQSFHPEEGFGMMKGGVNAAGGCVEGCIGTTVGFNITIIAIILLMAFC